MRTWCSLTALIAAILCVLAAPAALAAGGSPAGPEFRVNSYTTGYQQYPSVASDSSGNFVVVWASFSGEKGVIGQRYDASGSPLGGEFLVNTFTSGYTDRPSVARSPNGDFVVVWADFRSSPPWQIFGQRFSSTGAPVGGDFRINTVLTSTHINPVVAADSSGNFVVAWTADQDGSAQGIFGRRFSSSGAPLGSEFQVNSYTPQNQHYPAIAAASNGNFVIVWQSYAQDFDSDGVFGKRFASSGAVLGSDFRVNTYTTRGQIEPTVASDSSGNFVVAWASAGQDGFYHIFGQRFASSGAALGAEFVVNAYTTGYVQQTHPAAASDASGNFVMAWTDSYRDGLDEGVFGQRFGASGAPLGVDFQVNTYTPGQQRAAAAAAGSAGDFLVVWHSRHQDGDQFGVYAQRYAPILPVELIRFTAE